MTDWAGEGAGEDSWGDMPRQSDPSPFYGVNYMSNKSVISWACAELLAVEASQKVASALFQSGEYGAVWPQCILAYPVPRGGIFAGLLMNFSFTRMTGHGLIMTEEPERAHFIVDDIIDSGKTMKRFKERFPDKPFVALIDKTSEGSHWTGSNWVEFPWEAMSNESGPEENIVRILEYIGEDVTREGLKETPLRVVRSFRELYSGYMTNPDTIFKTFEDDTSDEMIVSKDIPFYSMCEHHMLPFVGHATIGYIPDKKIAGLSKLARLLECFSRRLQIQERLTSQVTAAIDKALQPRGSACVITAEHMCMSCRGVNKSGSKMVTSSLTGVFRSDPAVRQEFLSLARC